MGRAGYAPLGYSVFPGSVWFQSGNTLNTEISMCGGCLIFPFLCRYGHEGNIHLLGSWPHRNYLYSRRNSNNDVWTWQGGYLWCRVTSKASAPTFQGLRPQSIFSGECCENKHHQQFVFLLPCIISCLPLAFDHTLPFCSNTHSYPNKLAPSSDSSVFPLSF